MKEAYKHTIRWLGFSTLLAVLFGLVFGYLYNNYFLCLVMAFSISYTIWFLNCMLHIFVRPKIDKFSRGKKLIHEIVYYLITSLLGFVICMAIFSKVFKFDFFAVRLFLANLALLVILYGLISGLMYSFRFYRELIEKEAAAEKLKALAAEGELKALKAQINPHFLFNSLNSVNALITQDPVLARKMINRLSDLLRISLESRDRTLVPLKEELAFAHLYLEVEKVRFGDRMSFREEIDDELLGVPFPAMVLQPLFENAVRHGIAEKRGRGSIRLRLVRNEEQIECTMANTVSINRSRKKAEGLINGTGLENIRQRLDLLYGEKHSFRTGFSDADTFEVHLTLPVRPDEQD